MGRDVHNRRWNAAQPPDQRAKNTKSRRDEIIKLVFRFKSSRPCRALVWGCCDPAVALRSTAGYAHHTPAGLKNSEYFVGFFAWGA
ncbi:MAG: hypothetical protein LBJ67_12230 [Planctomycetaceae bacterium]|jgi:hypothetical protein|nr:hypothetical protein [Planctomycetaceae bacterium]